MKLSKPSRLCSSETLSLLPLRSAASAFVLADVELFVGFGGLQHELVQLPDLLVLEVGKLLLRQLGTKPHGAGPPARRLQHLSLQGVLVVLGETHNRTGSALLQHDGNKLGVGGTSEP